MNSWPRRLLLLGSGIAIGIGLVSLLQRFNPRNNPVPIPEAALPANWPQCATVNARLVPDADGNAGIWLRNNKITSLQEQVLVLWAYDSTQTKHSEQYPIISELKAADSIWIPLEQYSNSTKPVIWHYRLQSDSCQGVIETRTIAASISTD